MQRSIYYNGHTHEHEINRFDIQQQGRMTKAAELVEEIHSCKSNEIILTYNAHTTHIQRQLSPCVKKKEKQKTLILLK